MIPRRLHPSDIFDLYEHNLFIRFNGQSLQEVSEASKRSASNGFTRKSMAVEANADTAEGS